MDPLYVYYSQVNANDKGEERREGGLASKEEDMLCTC